MKLFDVGGKTMKLTCKQSVVEVGVGTQVLGSLPFKVRSELCRRNFTRLAGIVALVVLGSAAHGRITELLIDRRESPTF